MRLNAGARTRVQNIFMGMSLVATACIVVSFGLPGVVLASTSPESDDQPHHDLSRDTCTGMDLTYATTTPNDYLELPLEGTVNASVDWGDGSSTTTTTAGPTHNYANAGTYDVCITGAVTQFGFGSTVGGEVGYAAPGSNYLTSVNSWGSLGFTSLLGAFMGATSLTSVPDMVPASVTDISFMFDGDTSLNQSLDAWNTSSVTLMESVFNGATSFDQPLNNWTISSVTDTTDMFSNASDFNQPLNDWNTDLVTDMTGMFAGSGFDQNIDGWDMSSVTTISDMFEENLAFNQPLNDWNVSNVVNLSAVFLNDPVFNQPLNDWNTSNVYGMWQTFYGAKDFNQDLSSWNTSSVPNLGMYEMFDYSGLSANNYDSFLIAAASRPELQGVELDAAGIYYCSAAVPARAYLESSDDWSISDAGLGTTQCNGSTTTTTSTVPEGSTTTTSTVLEGSTTTTSTLPEGSTTTTTTVLEGSTTTTSVSNSTTTSVPSNQPPSRKVTPTMSATTVPRVSLPKGKVTLIARGFPPSATGIVSFVSGSIKLCASRVAHGEARCIAPKTLKRAEYKVRAHYGGDSRFLPRTIEVSFRII